MIKFNKESITNFFRANVQNFKNFPVVEEFLRNSDSLSQYLRLRNELDTHPIFRKLFITLLNIKDFEIDDGALEIKHGSQLSQLIKDNSIEISESEETWINNLDRITTALKGACCSTRQALSQELNHCYDDLVSQSNSDWIFVKNIKAFAGVKKILFTTSDGQSKEL
tara:strand:+ start:2748 stop:3248 length:501 start_codon:yes stop_codon:yes gene_type:complete